MPGRGITQILARSSATRPVGHVLKNLMRHIVTTKTVGSLHDLFAGGPTCLMYHRVVDTPPSTLAASPERSFDVTPGISAATPSSVSGSTASGSTSCVTPSAGISPSQIADDYFTKAPHSGSYLDWKISRGITMSAQEFEEQIKFCRQYFQCLSLPQAITNLTTGKLPRRSVIITFDDGYRDNLLTALPILEKYQVPATIFIAPGLIDDPSRMWWIEQEQIICAVASLSYNLGGQRITRMSRTREEKLALLVELAIVSKLLSTTELAALMADLREQSGVRATFSDLMLSWEELKKIALHPLITVGAHTINHLVLTSLSDQEARAEIVESKKKLEDILGIPVPIFAYPFGSREQAGEREARLAQEAGFTCALTTRPGHLNAKASLHPFLLPRIALEGQPTPAQSLAVLKWRLSGLPTFGSRFFCT